MSDMERWLQGLGLADYAPAFAAQHIEFDLLVDLGDDDLKQLGVETLGHRKRLLRAIAQLNGNASAPTTASPAALPEPQAFKPLVAARDAERRQLTVMFCDLVGSTALSRDLDPEDLQQLLLGYHDCVAAAVAPYEGHVARFLGDGVLVYFGFPRAHEDDAARSVQAALAIFKALDARASNVQLRARIGIATGQVVVGEIGTGTAAAEHTASGKTPNLAARLQAHAGPSEIVLSEETRELLGETFTLEPIAALELKGFDAQVAAWRVVGERRLATRFEAQHMQGLVTFVGRDSEIALLLERWALARDGEGQAVLLSGEAGIGKSRICQSLRERLANESVATVLLQCSPYFSSSALYPIVQHLERTAGMTTTDSPDVRAGKLEHLAGPLPEASLGCLLRLMGLPDGGRRRPGGASPREEKAHTLEALMDLLWRLSQTQPVLFLVEDAHWIDPTTEELIGQLAPRIRDARVLMLITSRPEYVPPWSHASQLTRHSLNRLSQRQCAALVGAVAGGKVLPDEVLAEIIRRTDGIPLFVEELTKTVMQSGLLQDTPAGYQLRGPLPALAIPATLQDSLMARLDRLAPAKEVAQVGAVIGREFGHRVIADVLSTMPAFQLDAALAELADSELVFRRGTPPDASYSFKHALVRDTAYNSLTKSQRVLRHRQIAAALEQGSRDGTATEPELLAFHHQEGGNAVSALGYWQTAGDQAVARSAMREAVVHYETAVALVDRVRAFESCDALELRLHIQLGNTLVQTEGWTSARANECFARARHLADALDLPTEQYQACGSFAGGLVAEGRFGHAISILQQFGASQLTRIDPMGRVNRLMRMGMIRTLQGEFAQGGRDLDEARREFENARPEESQWVGPLIPIVGVLVQLTQNLVPRGLLVSASSRAREGLAIAEQQQHLNSRVHALNMNGTMSAMRHEWTDSNGYFTQALELAQRYGLKAFGALSVFGLGRVLVATGHLVDGIRMLREGYSGWTTFGGRFFSTSFAGEAAEVLLEAGCGQAAIEFIASGEETQQETDESFQSARFICMRGQLAELDADDAQAEAAYRHALDVAERQGALLFSLHAATALARLRQSQDRADEADEVLRPIYLRFTEGFEYPALVCARELLEGRE